MWDLDSGREFARWKVTRARVLGVAVTADGRRAVSASGDKTLKVWDLGSGRSAPHARRALMLCQRRGGDGGWPAGGLRVYDKTLKVWDLGSGQRAPHAEGHASPVTGVAVTADGRRAVSASWDKTLKVWDLESGRELRTLEGHSESSWRGGDGGRATRVVRV